MVNHQTIAYDKNLPARIRLRDGPDEKCRGKPHWHEELELLYVDSGKLAVTAGNREYTLGAGNVLCINSAEIHAADGSARYLSVHVSPVFVKSFFEAADDFCYVLEDGTQERREMVFLMQKLLAVEQNPFDEYNALVKYSLLLKTLRLLLTRCRREKQLSVYGTGHSVQGDARAVKNYIEVNYRRKIMIAELAELTGCKPNGFTPYFKKLTGKRFTDYVQEVRTRHALEDYLTHDIPVGEAALKNGFCHYNHFTKACRKYYGASPTEIKSQKRGKQVSLPLEIPA